VKPSKHATNIYGFKNGISGITLGMVDGGLLNGILISNIRIDGPRVPIYMRLGDRGRVFKEDMPKPGVGLFSNVMLSNIYATSADTIGCSITGIPGHPLEGVTLKNIKLSFKGGAKNDIDLLSVKEEREHYPESTMFGKLPAYGFFIRHAKNISLTDIEIDIKTNDDRPVIVADDVNNLRISGLNAQTGLHTPAYIHLRNSTDVWINDSQPRSSLKTFLWVGGKNIKNIVVSGNNLTKVEETFQTDREELMSEIKTFGNISK
jgi:hypothetical protein